jgi:hypothetical protein
MGRSEGYSVSGDPRHTGGFASHRRHENVDEGCGCGCGGHGREAVQELRGHGLEIMTLQRRKQLSFEPFLRFSLLIFAD